MLFRSAAATYGERVVGVVLSGTRDDGTAGLRAIHQRGGMGVVQDPAEALFPGGMPQSAVEGDSPDFVLPAGEMGELLSKLARGEQSQGGPDTMPDELDAELHWANPELLWAPPEEPPLGRPSGFTCPECHGGLWEIGEEGLPRYRCRVGRGFSADSLLVTQRVDVDQALWTAYRALEERAALFRRLADRAHGRHASISAEQFRAEEADVNRQAEVLRSVLCAGGVGGDERESDPTIDS